MSSERFYRVSRRKFLASTAALALTGNSSATEAANPLTHPPRPEIQGRKPLAVLTTVYRPLSHSQHIAGRFLHGYSLQGNFHIPEHFVQSLYVDQRPDNDLSREAARESNVRITRSVTEALTLGGSKLAVDAVLLIAEHGNYPRNDKGQVLYPRYEFFKEMVEVFRKTGQSVPVFCDKHLSYSWAKAKEMVAWSHELKFPLMAGSSLPVTWRMPELEPKLDTPFEEGLVAAFGPLEIYGFDALEALQVMLERRAGSETGVKAITCLSGKDVWKAGDEGRWSWDLLGAALSRSETLSLGDLRRNVGSTPVAKMPASPALAFLIDYSDGTRGTVLLLNGHMQDFCFAGKVRGEPKLLSCLYQLPGPPGSRYFDALVHNIEKLFETRQSPCPVERTLLTTGILEAVMESHHHRGSRIETPDLNIRYAAQTDSAFLRGSVTTPA